MMRSDTRRLELDLAEVAAHLRLAARESDDALADVIAECSQQGLDTTLGFFLECVPDLVDRSIPLDAAIEAAVHTLVARGRSPDDAFRDIEAAHPALARAIAAARLLGEAMRSTGSLAVQLADSGPLTLPCHQGPLLPDGQCRYLLHQLLGVGSQGAVYLAVDRALSEPSHPAYVAVKRRFPSSGITQAAWNRGDEATKARRVIHPNVVRTLDRFVAQDGTAYLVQEYVRGGSLEAWRRGRAETVPARHAAEVVAQVARGVQAAHGAGLIHRDIKPSNILLSEAGVPKVTDFGIASADPSARAAERQGSLAFIAPEQYRLEPLTTAADVYALGGLLYWLLTSRNPNGQTPEEASVTLGRRDVPEGPSLRAHRADVDRDLEAICRRALSPERSHRYASADALANDLEAWLRREPIGWNAPAPWWRLTLSVRRSPRTAALLVVGALAMLAATAWSTWSLNRAEIAREQAARHKAEELARSDADALRRAKVVASTINSIFDKRDPDHIGTNWMIAVTSLEGALGPRLMAPGPDDQLLWPKRITAARQAVAEFHAAGRQDEYECAVWESSLCLWLLKDGAGAAEAQEAARRLDPAIAWWQARLQADDPWITLLVMLRECAAVVALGSGEEQAPARRDRLARAEAAAARLPQLELAARNVLERARRAASAPPAPRDEAAAVP